MNNKINSISQCSILIKNSASSFSGINLAEAKMIVEKIVMIDNKYYIVQPVDFGLINSRFINFIKNGQEDEAKKIIAGCLGKCSSRMDELVEFDIYSKEGKTTPSRIIVDAIRWAEFARQFMFRLNKYRATGVIYDPKFKKE